MFVYQTSRGVDPSVEIANRTKKNMNSKKIAKPRPPKKNSPDQQAVVDEILQVVRDQGKRMSLSNTDYRLHKRLSQNHFNGSTETFKDDSGSWCTSSSDLSYSPPATPLETSVPYFSESDSEQAPEPVTRNNRTNLPPLDLRKVRRPSCPIAPRLHKDIVTKDSDQDGEIHQSWPVKPKISRPKSARGVRTRGRFNSIASSSDE